MVSSSSGHELATAVLLGLGTARIVETVKEVLPLNPPAQYKSGTAIALAAGGAAVMGDGWRSRLLIGVGAAGASMIVHTVSALLSHLDDRQKVAVLRATMR